MLPSEAKDCLARMFELFPQGVLADKEIELFLRRLLPFFKPDAIKAIEDHRCDNEYKKPKFNKILGSLGTLNRRDTKAPESKHKTAIGYSMVRENSWLDGKPEAESLLHYARYWFFRYRADKLKRCDAACHLRPDLRSEFEADFRKAVDERRAGILSQLKNDLWNILDEQQATRLAEWFDAKSEDYREVIDQIRQGLVEVEVGAVPDFA